MLFFNMFFCKEKQGKKHMLIYGRKRKTKCFIENCKCFLRERINSAKSLFLLGESPPAPMGLISYQ